MGVGVYGSIAAAVGVSGWVIYNMIFGEDDARKEAVRRAAEEKFGDPSALPSGNTGSNTSISRPPIAEAFPLKIGDKNAYVQDVQNALIKMGGAPANYILNSGGADGQYGEGTRDALLATNFIQALDYLWKGNAYTNISRELYNKITNYGLGALQQSRRGTAVAKIATANKDTWVLDEKGLKSQPAKGIPVRKGTVLGYYIMENNGLAKILRKNGTHVYTAFSNLTII